MPLPRGGAGRHLLDPAGALSVLRSPGRSLGWTSNPFCQTQPDCATIDDVSVFLGAATALTQRLMPAAPELRSSTRC